MTEPLIRILSVFLFWGSALTLLQAEPKRQTSTFYVAPNGDDHDPGTAERPFQTCERAQQAVRTLNGTSDVVVDMADGIYRLPRTLVFAANDGGLNGHRVSWQAHAGAHPVISGAIRVSGWKLSDAQRGIYVAEVPRGVDTRQLWVNGHLSPIASSEIPRSSVYFTRNGIVFKEGKAGVLPPKKASSKLEVVATGFFTKRISPVESITGNTLQMKQPAWDNNIWGYDSLSTPYFPEFSHLYLANAIELLHEPGQWFLDAEKSKLYLKIAEGTDINRLDVELPHLAVLISIGNSIDNVIRDLTFEGIRFSHTTWLGPSSAEGYASQQSGAYLAGHAEQYPASPLETCAYGCPEFETERNEWSQMPASIQVSAAQRVTFRGNVFSHLGQYALGIGNDANATMSGVGLAASDITVVGNRFTDLAGGAILAGGVQRAAHHPPDPRMINRQIIIRSNWIESVSQDYTDNAAILSTYVLGAVILHNDISNIPYDAIDIGYGWGMHDPFGNANYRIRMHGYDWPQNLVYQTPTTHQDVVVAGNKIHGAKKFFHDGGAIYNLSASPGTLITENYIYDNNALIALYLDEGSRYITLRKNVVQDHEGEWLNINTVHSAYPLRISPDNTAADNWHDSSKTGGLWTNYQNDLILDDHLVQRDQWPEEAQKIMKEAGIETSIRLPEEEEHDHEK